MTDADDPAAASTTPDPPTPASDRRPEAEPAPALRPDVAAMPDPDPEPAATPAIVPPPGEPPPPASPDPTLEPAGAPEPAVEHGPERPSAAGQDGLPGPEPIVDPPPSTAAEPGTQLPAGAAPEPAVDPPPSTEVEAGSDASAADGPEPNTDLDMDMAEILALVDQIEARAALKSDVGLDRLDAEAPGIELASAVEPEPERGIELDDEPGPEPDPEPELGDEPEPSHRLRAADPADQRRRDVAPAGQVLAVMVATLLLAAGLNSDAMLRSAEASPLGPGRDLAVGFWRPVYQVSNRIGLTGPRDGLDALRRLGSGEGDPDDGDGTELVAGLPSAPAGPSVDQGTGGGTEAATGPAGPGPGDGDGVEATPNPGTGLLGLDPAGLGDGTADSTANGPARGPLAGEAPQGPPSPVAPTTAPPTTGTRPAPSPSTTAPPDGTLRRPTPADPLRILLVGDSTMDAVGAAVLRGLEPTGVTRAAVDYKVSSGLARPDFFDWPAHLREARTTTRFELVVIMMGANDAQPFMIDGHAENFGTERWLATYRQRVAALLQQLTADGGGVLWIGQPVMRKETFDADMQQIDRIYAEEVAKVPRARYLDSRAILSDEEGAYATHLVDAAGDRQRVRQDDGIHLTEAGAERLAPAVVDAINTLAPLY